MSGRLTHLTEAGEVRMVDVGDKAPLRRRAVAGGRVRAGAATVAAMLEGDVPKGDVAAVARVAGIMAAKRTAELIPLCHPLPLEKIEVTIRPDGATAIEIRAEVVTTSKTGVEMEALTAVSAAALTVYDMLKGIDRDLEIERVRLIEKTKGKPE